MLIVFTASRRYILADLLGANVWRLGVENGEVERSLPYLDPQKFRIVIVMRHPDLLQSSPTPSLRLQLLSGYPLERSRNIDTPYRPYFDLVRIKILNFNLYLFLKIENKAVFTFHGCIIAERHSSFVKLFKL